MYLTLLLLCSALQLHIVYSNSPGVCKNQTEVEPDDELPRTCLDLLCQGYVLSDIYYVYPDGRENYFIKVYCDQKTAGGGWTAFQRRFDGGLDFYRNWQNYKLGFGYPYQEFWLGLENIHNLLSLHPENELLIYMERFSNEAVLARYGKFDVGDETSGYELSIGKFTGSTPPGDSLLFANNQKFSTYDRDQDTWPNNCAEKFQGAWWYKSCHQSNLNGFYHKGKHDSFADGINWKSFTGYHESLKTTIMMFRETSSQATNDPY